MQDVSAVSHACRYRIARIGLTILLMQEIVSMNSPGTTFVCCTMLCTRPHGTPRA
jgi:hypothetical protein